MQAVKAHRINLKEINSEFGMYAVNSDLTSFVEASEGGDSLSPP